MVTTTAQRFTPFHRGDRNFFLVYLLLILAGIVTGFGWDVVHRLHDHKASWPIMVHVHAFFFVAWLAFLATQITLVRVRNVDLHMRLGWVGVGLAVIMEVMGVSVAWYMDNFHMKTPAEADPSFLSIQLDDLILFPVLVTTGILMRNRAPSAHKRLMLLATVAISDAGFARIGFEVVPQWFGHDFLPMFTMLYIGPVLLLLGMGAYDLITRRRLHPAWMFGAGLILLGETSATALYLTPAWKGVALKLLGH
jgi:hypothetical protein